MWLIPGKTKVKTEIFKGIGFLDLFIGLADIGVLTLLIMSNIPYKYVVAAVLATIFVFNFLRIDDEPNYMFFFHILKHNSSKRHYKGTTYENLTDGVKPKQDTVKVLSAFTGISDNQIEYGGEYFGAALEIPAVEFRFFTQTKKNNTIVNGLGKVLRAINPDYTANIVKLDRPMNYQRHIDFEYKKLEELKKSFETGNIREDELQARVEIIYDRIKELQSLNSENKVYNAYYYIVLFDSDRHQLETQINDAAEILTQAFLSPFRLDSKELAIFLKYTNNTNVDESQIETLQPEDYATWAMPDKVDIWSKILEIDRTFQSVKRITNYPGTVGDAWLATVMSMPGTRVTIKCKPMDREKAIKSIDRSLNELRVRLDSTAVESQVMELQSHIQSLSDLLETLHGENENLLQMNIYVNVYDMVLTERWRKEESAGRTDLPRVNNVNKVMRRFYKENGFRLTSMDFQQLDGFIASQVSAYDPFAKEGRGVPSNTLGASYPWIFASIEDRNGIKLGTSDGVPVFLDFFRRDSERVNSNMVIVGKSGSGKSYATKSILSNLAADDAKVFILDPENEYSQLAHNLHGKLINVGNAQYGRMNPFHIITALDDEDSDSSQASGTYETHLQFLEEFFKQILPGCEKDALEHLNSLVDRTYMEKGITAQTDLSKLTPTDYPTFDDLYDSILREFQETDNEYLRKMLRTLINYIQKFATGGRNANIWNGPSTITTEEHFTVFNFQSLLSNRNNTIANAQMLLVLKYIDNEIIKNRDYNIRYNAKRKIIVVVDEAHVFIDDKFPIALDFMYQLAKRIRKYNGMQIVITQNIKDFVGTEELARKSAAIINACQYSCIFSLAPNDMEDLCRLYEKAGGINESEQEQIVGASRGQVFTILGPESRSAFKVEVPENVVDMFENMDFESKYFVGEGGDENWENYIGDSRAANEQSLAGKKIEKIEAEQEKSRRDFVTLEIIEGASDYQKPSVTLEKLSKQEESEETDEDEIDEDEDEFEESEDIDDTEEEDEEEEIPAKYERPVSAGIDYAALAAAMANANAGSSRTEEKLTALVEKLSSDNLEQRIENAVNARVSEALAKIGAEGGKTSIREEMTSGRGSSLGSIFDDDDDDEDETRRRRSSLLDDDDDDDFLDDDDDFLDDDLDDDDDDDEDDDDLDDDDNDDDDDDNDDDDDGDGSKSDFMKMFVEGVNRLGGMSAIEMMDVYDEKTTEVTLADLDKYILNVKRGAENR